MTLRFRHRSKADSRNGAFSTPLPLLAKVGRRKKTGIC